MTNYTPGATRHIPKNLVETAHEDTGKWLNRDDLETWVFQRIAELEAAVEQHKAAEEMQIALRKKADEREAALAAHVERLHSTLEPFARAWQQREPIGDHNSKGYQRKLERALLPFYSTGNVDEFSLTGEHLREAARALSAAVGTASLASLVAEKQAEAMERLADRKQRESEAEEDFSLRSKQAYAAVCAANECTRLRQQAEGGA